MSSIESIGSSQSTRFRFRRNILKMVHARLVAWGQMRRTRRQLAELSDGALQDLGLTREAALEEALRPFWDTTSRRRKY